MEERRVPETLVVRGLRDPEPAVLQEVVQEARVAQVGLDPAESGEDHRVVDRQGPGQPHGRHQGEVARRPQAARRGPASKAPDRSRETP